MIKKFQTPAGKLELEALPEEEKLKLQIKTPQIVNYSDYKSPIIEDAWTQENVINTIHDIKNELQNYEQQSNTYPDAEKPQSSMSRFKGTSGKINPASWLLNWNVHRGDLTQQNLSNTKNLYGIEQRGNAKENIVKSTVQALTSYPNPTNTPNQQLDHAVQSMGITPAVQNLAKEFNLNNSDAQQKYRDIMQFRYNAKINPKQRNISDQQIDDYIQQYDSEGLFNNMSDEQKRFIFNDLAYNEKRNEGTAFAKQGKRLMPKRKKGKLC